EGRRAGRPAGAVPGVQMGHEAVCDGVVGPEAADVERKGAGQRVFAASRLQAGRRGEERQTGRGEEAEGDAPGREEVGYGPAGRRLSEGGKQDTTGVDQAGPERPLEEQLADGKLKT